MYPHERTLVKRLANQPFVLLGVNSDDSPEKAKKAITREKMTWRSFFDGGLIGGPIATRWGVRGWPTIYVVDKRGIIRFKGPRGAQLDAAVDQLLAEPSPTGGKQ